MQSEKEKNEYPHPVSNARDAGRETSDFEYFSKIDGRGDTDREHDAFFEKLVLIKHDSTFFKTSVKKYRAQSLSAIKCIAGYETSRLEYKLGLERYRYSADPNAGEKHEREIKHRIFGIKLDVDANLNGPRGENIVISTPDSKVKVVVIPTDEEYMIASDTYDLVK